MGYSKFLQTYLWAQSHMFSVPFPAHPYPNILAALMTPGKKRAPEVLSVLLFHDPVAAPVFPTEYFRENIVMTKSKRMTGRFFE